MFFTITLKHQLLMVNRSSYKQVLLNDRGPMKSVWKFNVKYAVPKTTNKQKDTRTKQQHNNFFFADVDHDSVRK